jgi:uncharacterized membrane protein YeaQ/YmgE (transglycosylase-associated protein family)
MPGDNEPTGFVLTAILGILGAFVATYLGQASAALQPASRTRSVQYGLEVISLLVE